MSIRAKWVCKYVPILCYLALALPIPDGLNVQHVGLAFALAASYLAGLSVGAVINSAMTANAQKMCSRAQDAAIAALKDERAYLYLMHGILECGMLERGSDNQIDCLEAVVKDARVIADKIAQRKIKEVVTEGR